MNNKKVKDLLIVNLVFIIIFITMSILISNSLYKNYKNVILENDNYIKEEVNKLYPDNEEINKIFEDKDLTKYDKTLKSKSIKSNLTISIISLISLGLINMLYIVHCHKQITEADDYINNALNNKFDYNLDNYFDKDIDSLKKDVHTLILKLQEKNQLLAKERLKLEQILDDIYNQMRLSNINIKVNDKSVALRNQKQVEKIELLISGLIKLSKLDSGTTKLKLEKIKLSSLITKAIEPLKEVIKYRKINIKLNIRNTDVEVDPYWMSEAIFNIIKNACQHTKDEITIESTTNQECTEIRISNNGEMIDEKIIPTIFEKFQSTNSDGVGIGLNLSKEIIERQNGNIEVLNNGQTTFVIKLYKK